MKQFIGRTDEMEVLDKEYNRESGFVVIYGRRRVGKTTLIKEFIRGKNALYFLATEELEVGNRQRFASALADLTNQDFLKQANFADWESLIKLLVTWNPKEKKVIVIDEFQYLVSVNPAFPSILQRIWDEVLQGENVMLILCGSLIGMMVTHALSYSSPLYGRRTAQLRVSPLKFSDLRGINLNRPFEEVVEEYAVTGGVPKYMDFFEGSYPLMETIEKEILLKGSFLYEEPTFLLEKEVRELVSYFSIIKTIAAGQHKLSQIGATLGLPSSSMTPYLKLLMDLEIVEKRVPITEAFPEKSRKGLYFIKDHFIHFWFKFVFPYKGELEMDNVNYVLEKIRQQFIENHVSFVYEEVCRSIFIQLCKAGDIEFNAKRVGAYWNNHCEIDLMAINEVEKQVYVGECKYRNKPVDADVLFELMKKVESLTELKLYQVHYILFSKSGFTKRLMDQVKNQPSIVLVNEDKKL